MLEQKDIEMIRNVVEDVVVSIKEDVAVLKEDVTKINLTLENIVMPRLCTIEDCYTSTYHRYSEGIGQLETMQMDIDILKETAAQHGERLQRLA